MSTEGEFRPELNIFHGQAFLTKLTESAPQRFLLAMSAPELQAQLDRIEAKLDELIAKRPPLFVATDRWMPNTEPEPEITEVWGGGGPIADV